MLVTGTDVGVAWNISISFMKDASSIDSFECSIPKCSQDSHATFFAEIGGERLYENNKSIVSNYFECEMIFFDSEKDPGKNDTVSIRNGRNPAIFAVVFAVGDVKLFLLVERVA